MPHAVQITDRASLQKRAAEPRQRIELTVDHRSDARHAPLAATTDGGDVVAFTAGQAVEYGSESALHGFALLESHFPDVETRSLRQRKPGERFTEGPKP